MRNDPVTTEHVTTRDGIRLATDIRLPPGPGPFPVILSRTPYGRHLQGGRENTAANPTIATPDELAAYYAAHGYATVIRTSEADSTAKAGSKNTSPTAMTAKTP